MVKVTVKTNFKNDFLTPIQKYKITWGIGEVLRFAIPSQILKGISPVKGERFKKYSRPYLTAIKSGQYKQYGKKTSPVNLKLSGKLINSLKVNQKIKSVEIYFSDKKAVYHDEDGAGKSKVLRRMLPWKKGESWNFRIESAIQKFLDNLAL